MKTWVRKTLSVGVLAAGALLFAPGAAHADVNQSSSGSNGVLNGTQLVAPINVPLNVVGNAIGVGGEANAAGTGANWLAGGGKVSQDSSDNNGIGNGTQAYLPVTVPVNVVGNAAGVLGEANAAGAGSNGRTESAQMTEGGKVSQDSSDNNGVLNGTQLYSPVDVPINVCGNSLALLGEGNAQAMCGTGHATEGGKVSQDSSDNNGIGNGTQVYAPISLPVNLAGNAVGVLGEGNAAAAATNESGTAASGTTKQDSSDNNGVLNGTQVTAPVHVPVNVCGNALGVLGAANASAACSNGTPGDDNAGDNGGDTPGDDNGGDGGTQGGGYGTPARKAHAAKATEASPVDGLTQGVEPAGGLNVGGLDLLNTLR